MVKRLLVGCWLGFGLAACGGPAPSGPGLNVSLVVGSAVGPLDKYLVRVFGAAVKCSEVLASPTSYELGAQATCDPADADTSTDCLVAFQSFSANGGDASVDHISPGQRTVFVEGVEGGAVVAHGCGSVLVKSGHGSDATVTIQ